MGFLNFLGPHKATIRDALYNNAATVEFSPQGAILDASPAFIKATGYSKNDLVGQSYRKFFGLDAAGTEAAAFWQAQLRGNTGATLYRMTHKTGHDVWLRGTFMPLRTSSGQVMKLMLLAFDVTTTHAETDEKAYTLQAVDRSQAIISFTLDGIILDANENFLKTIGYQLSEIKGQHHRLFVEPDFANSEDYQKFWQRLRNGEFFTASYHRIGKGGRDIWLQASYCPVFNAQGKVVKIVKFASDTTSYMRSTAQIGAALASLAAGNLCTRIEQPLVAALDTLRVAFNDSASAMHQAVQDVLISASAINEISESVSESVQLLSNRTEQQAAGVEEAISAFHQLTGSIQKYTENAAMMRSRAEHAKSETDLSDHVVGKAVHTMGEIDQSSAKISNIIGVIDEIAFQTNLLALNAGVEAARAGNAGRGFAVVATEVRALAQRSADAAKEIKQLISTSAQIVSSGVKSVAEAHQSLDRIAGYINEIDSSANEAATDAKAQLHTLTQVDVAMLQMEKATQANASMADKTADASQGLASEAHNIMRLLSRFKAHA